VILAGGSGTREGHESRRKAAEQVLELLDGKRPMIQKTMERLLPAGNRKRNRKKRTSGSLPMNCWPRNPTSELPAIHYKAQVCKEPEARKNGSANWLGASCWRR